MFQVYTSVRVTEPAHPRLGQVGVVVGSKDPVDVRFYDASGEVIETINGASLQGL